MNNIKIKELYLARYDYQDFYEIVSSLINENKLFGDGTKQKMNNRKFECKNGDIRVDLPICFGSEKATYRMVILGLEPRDSNSKFNINHSGKFVFGTPFGIEYWSEKNKYYRSFKSLLKRNDCFIYFTDVVKEYEVQNSKGDSDKNARKTFWEKASKKENVDFLIKEIEFIKPTHIIALGNDTYSFLVKYFGDKVVKVKHPNARQDNHSKLNAWEIIEQKINSIF